MAAQIINRDEATCIHCGPGRGIMPRKGRHVCAGCGDADLRDVDGLKWRPRLISSKLNK